MINTVKNYIKNRKRFIDVRNINKVTTYKPKSNKIKVGILGTIFIACLITPCTNWIIPTTLKVISKFNPLWIYK